MSQVSMVLRRVQGDTTHTLAGRTVPLPALPPDTRHLTPDT